MRGAENKNLNMHASEHVRRLEKAFNNWWSNILIVFTVEEYKTVFSATRVCDRELKTTAPGPAITCSTNTKLSLPGGGGTLSTGNNHCCCLWGSLAKCWTPSHYTHAIWEQSALRWISRARNHKAFTDPGSDTNSVFKKHFCKLNSWLTQLSR